MFSNLFCHKGSLSFLSRIVSVLKWTQPAPNPLRFFKCSFSINCTLLGVKPCQCTRRVSQCSRLWNGHGQSAAIFHFLIRRAPLAPPGLSLQYSLWATILGNRGVWQSSSECIQLNSDPVSPRGAAVTQKAELVQLLVLVVCWLTWHGSAGKGLSHQCPWKCFPSETAGASAQCCGNSPHVPVFSRISKSWQECGYQLWLMCPIGSGSAACTKDHNRNSVW